MFFNISIDGIESVLCGITADKDFDAFPCTDKRTESILSIALEV